MRSPSRTIWSALTATTLGVICLLLLMSGCANAEGVPERTPLAVVRSEATAPLDIKSLEVRLAESKAIGALTKLNLKAQVDDLLEQFRAHYRGQPSSSLTDLRRTYDQLVFRVLALLRDADPQLATAVASSREPIWSVLSNPAKFASM